MLSNRSSTDLPRALSFIVPFDGFQRNYRDTWKDWLRGSGDDPPYLRPEFFALTRRLLEPSSEALLVVATVDRVVKGVMPVVLSERQLHYLRSDHSPRLDFRASSIALSSAWQALLSDPRWDHFFIDCVPSESPLATELVMLARRDGCVVQLSPYSRVGQLRLPDFEANMDSKFRANVKRCCRKAGSLVFERHTAPSNALIHEAYSIEANAWKGRLGTSIDSDPRLMRFYGALLRTFGRRGQMSLNFVVADGKRVACLFTLEDAHTLYAAKIGYDSAYSALSPGHLMVYLTALDAERRGLQTLDFLGVESEWKRKWTDDFREHVQVVIFRPSLRSYAGIPVREIVRTFAPQNVCVQARKFKDFANRSMQQFTAPVKSKC